MLIQFTKNKQWPLAVLTTACLLLSACNTNRYQNTTIEFLDGSVYLHMNLPMSVYIKNLSDYKAQVYDKEKSIGQIVLEDAVQTNSTPEETIGDIWGDRKGCGKVVEEYSLPEQYMQYNNLFSNEDGRMGILAFNGNLCVATEFSKDSLSADEICMLIGSMVIEA